MRKVAAYGACLGILLVGCKKAEQKPTSETSTLQNELNAAEIKYAAYPKEISQIIKGYVDGSAQISDVSDPLGWKLYHWDNPIVGKSVDLWANPADRSQFFLTINEFNGDLTSPTDATYLVENKVHTIKTANQAFYWCVSEGDLSGSALYTSFSTDRQDVFLKSPAFLQMRPDYTCS